MSNESQSRLRVLTEETRISLPFVMIITAVTVCGTAGATYGVIQSRLADSERRDTSMERRIEKLEDQFAKAVVLLERIDERTASMTAAKKGIQ
jgi:hypothetical protein